MGAVGAQSGGTGQLSEGGTPQHRVLKDVLEGTWQGIEQERHSRQGISMVKGAGERTCDFRLEHRVNGGWVGFFVFFFFWQRDERD